MDNNNNNNVTPENNISVDNNGVVENNKKSSNSLVLLAIIGGLIIAVGVVLGILIGNKDDKKNSKEKDLPSSVLSKVKTSGQMENFVYEYDDSETQETLDNIIKDKNNLYGVKLGLEGNIKRTFCDYKNKGTDYKFKNVDSDSPIFESGKINVEFSNSLKGIKNAYYLANGGCDSYHEDLLGIQYKDKLVLYTSDFELSKIYLTIDLKKNYDMIYILNISTAADDESANQGINSYIIGETSDGTIEEIADLDAEWDKMYN